ncbi:MAG: tRNA guanosine(34) transglycosylase Tgt [SAR324 cluster bacterium]|nr:tRNA guanosine(34) transglycosylase Tgt [SAR324 cluster bacterium]MCZ6728193.1 tRNA guanosine(34) transglycosylase Tgt [SAR324 cluster bacterium]MCZ6843304.1 tRNA guanosine(34) transglycosylase Tgt [SAR324 cluster bacterium]
MQFKLLATDPACGARLGVISTPKGEVPTPAFMPVATQGTVKAMLPDWVAEKGARILLANTYHLHLKPGEDVIAALGGLHKFMNWPHLIITDSGGYQVFSLPEREISEEGVRFRTRKQGQPLLLTPESTIAIQEKLGADIVMAFDECVAYPTPHEYAKEAMERTIRWAERCKRAHGRKDQALFGIVQGSTYPDLRRACAEAIADLDLPGIAVGGLSVGEGLEVMREVLSYTVPYLPADRPRYLMGVGLPEDILAAVEAGMDMSDCVIPTKYARSGMLFTQVGRLRVSNAEYRKDRFPPDTSCGCYTCAHYTRAYLHHLFQAGEILGQTLASIHNMHFYLTLMENIRQAISEARFLQFKEEFLSAYQRQSKKTRHVR